MELRLYDTMKKEERPFQPLDPKNVRMYVCGPTVYDFAHIGNARPVIVFDVLFRLLRHVYGKQNVTYVRNITDVDDKINDRATRDFPDLPLNDAIRKVTEKTAAQFHADVKALGCLEPTYQPRATEFVLPRPDGKSDMVTLIGQLIARGHAYEAAGEVLFDTQSMPDYGLLSGRKLEEQKAGARIEVDAHKKNPQDFVLWKQSSANEPGWDSPWGRGRPGWHIECSAMSAAYLGETFDIHGGGLDLIFPHHENEIAQSRCAHGTHAMANYWMHNGFLQVEGEKMSKSLGNFITIHELLSNEKFGGRRWSGEIVRLAMLKTHYSQPIDWTIANLIDAEKTLEKWRARAWLFRGAFDSIENDLQQVSAPDQNAVAAALMNNLNTPEAIAVLDSMSQTLFDPRIRQAFSNALDLMGFSKYVLQEVKKLNEAETRLDRSLTKFWNEMGQTKRQNDEQFSLSDGLVLESLKRKIDAVLKFSFSPNDLEEIEQKLKSVSLGTRTFRLRRMIHDGSFEVVKNLLADRASARARKDFKESDRIRDELAAMGVTLKDGKDASGNPVTTWEVAR